MEASDAPRSEAPSSSQASSARVQLLIVSLVIVAWLALLAVRGGSTFDQNQHAHIAWALGEGQRLGIDFVDHHFPLWWTVLRLYPLAGVETGVEILSFARGVVVVLGAALIVQMWAIHRTGDASAWPSTPWPAWASALAVMLTAEAFWCSRPEVLAMVCVAAAILWVRRAAAASPRSRAAIVSWFAAGLVFAVGVAATPRTVVFGGVVVLAVPAAHWRAALDPRSWGWAIAGGVAMLVVLLVLTDFSIDGARWDLRLSKALMSQGQGARAGNVGAIVASGVVPACLLSIPALRQRPRLTLARLGYCAAVVGVLLLLQGRYLWQHSVATSVMSFPLMLAVIVADAGAPKFKAWRAMERLWPVAAVAAIAWTFHSEADDRFMRSQRRRIRAGLAEVADGRPVAIPYLHHPISAADGVRHLLEHNPAAALRICPAIESLPGGHPYPTCDFVGDIQRTKPVLIDEMWLQATLTDAQREQLAGLLGDLYERRLLVAGRYLTYFMVRQDAVAAFERVAIGVAGEGLRALELELSSDDPALPSARQSVAQVLFQGGESQRALRMLEQAIEDLEPSPTLVQALTSAAFTARGLGQPERELEFLQAAVTAQDQVAGPDEGQSIGMRLELMRRARDEGRTKLALQVGIGLSSRVAGSTSAPPPLAVSLHAELATLQSCNGDTAGAARSLERAAAIGGLPPPVRQLLQLRWAATEAGGDASAKGRARELLTEAGVAPIRAEADPIGEAVVAGYVALAQTQLSGPQERSAIGPQLWQALQRLQSATDLERAPLHVRVLVADLARIRGVVDPAAGSTTPAQDAFVRSVGRVCPRLD